MMRFLLLVVLAAALVLPARGNWPQFRGPHGNGVSDAKGLPLKWSETENVKWKVPINGKAWSSPVIWGDQIWLSNATEDGTRLSVLCLDARTGKIIRNQQLFNIPAPQYCHPFNSYGSPTPVIEAGRIYVTFGSPGTACLDTKTGKVLWERHDLKCYHYRGSGSSPIVFGNLLIMHFDGSDLQYVVALDKHTGRTVWKTDRSVDFKDLDAEGKITRDGDWRKGYSTPTIVTVDGRPVLISAASKATYAYDPADGRELWRVEEQRFHSGTVRPVFGHGLIYTATGLAKGELWAVRPGGSGVVTDTHVVWKVARNVPNRPSPLLLGDLLYIIDDGGIASCLEAKTGAQIWNERVGGNMSASPLYADGRIYFFNEEGKGTVIAAGREFKVLAENRLAEGFMASPAVHGQALILRSKTSLYRIEE